VRNIIIFTAVLMGLALTCGGSDVCRVIDPGPLVANPPTIDERVEHLEHAVQDLNRSFDLYRAGDRDWQQLENRITGLEGAVKALEDVQ
jgi:hypothetical protein